MSTIDDIRSEFGEGAIISLKAGGKILKDGYSTGSLVLNDSIKRARCREGEWPDSRYGCGHVRKRENLGDRQACHPIQGGE